MLLMKAMYEGLRMVGLRANKVRGGVKRYICTGRQRGRARFVTQGWSSDGRTSAGNASGSV